MKYAIVKKGFFSITGVADIFNYHDIAILKSEAEIKLQGKMRTTEGQHYLVQDGDIVHVKFNV